MKRIVLYKLAIVFLLSIACGALQSENWAQWRGPYLNGSTSEKNLPVSWSPPSSNVLWTTPLPGPSAATPIIWEDTVFVTTPDDAKDLHLFCINAKDGKIKWQRKVSTGNRVVNQNNMASPSPVTDGKIVISMFGTGDIAAFDFDGNQKWKRSLADEYGKFALMYLYSSSPLLFNGKLYIQVLQRNDPNAYPHSKDNNPTRESFILCLDPSTGKTLWRHTRKTDASMESMESYATPIPHKIKNGFEILIVGGDYLTGHNVDTGDEFWRCGGINARKTDMQRNWYRIVPSPVPANDVIVVCAPKGSPVIGIKENGKGLITDTHIAWTCSETTSDWSTPLFYNNYLFVMDGGKRTLTKLDPATGKVVWTGYLGVSERIWSSPTGADNKIYMISEKGTVIVCSAEDQFKIIATNPLDESLTRTSVAISGSRIFLRTAKNLYCIGKK